MIIYQDRSCPLFQLPFKDMALFISLFLNHFPSKKLNC